MVPLLGAAAEVIGGTIAGTSVVVALAGLLVRRQLQQDGQVSPILAASRQRAEACEAELHNERVLRTAAQARADVPPLSADALRRDLARSTRRATLAGADAE